MNRADRRRSKQKRTASTKNPTVRIEDLFSQAVAYWESGNTEHARQVCARILRTQPDHSEAINLTGVLLVEANRYDIAIEYFARAGGIEPENASYRYNHADALHSAQNLQEAELSYTAVLKQVPKHPRALAGMGRLCQDRGRPDDALRYFHAALTADPANLDAVCGIARALGQQGRTEEAVNYIRGALRASPDLSKAQSEMFAALKAGQEQQIPLWHFSMLADNDRNMAYQQAIEKLTAETSEVLEIGTGSGLLALMAASAGAAHVTACEMSTPVAEAATRVVAENGYSDTIDVVAKPSLSLRIGVDMPRRANILVSEILDSGLTGEGVVKFVRHAKRELLINNARIIPARADVKAILVSLPRLRPANPLTSVCGFDLSAFARFQNLQDYQSIDLKHEPNDRLSDEFDVETFDFYNLPPEASIDNPYEKTIDVKVLADGPLHAIAFWFDLHLDDDITVSSGPKGGVVHWGQAVQFFADDIAIGKGDIVRLRMYFDEIKIRWKIDQIIAC